MVSLAKTSEVAGVTKGRKRGKIANLYQWVEKGSKRKERREKVTTRKIWEKAHG